MTTVTTVTGTTTTNPLLDAIDVIEILNDRDVDIRGVAYHSQRVKPGDVFVCVRGFKTDGHRYAGDAVARGAVALVVEELLPELEVPQFRVKDARASLAALGDAFYSHPSGSLKCIGITATNGKTTTAFMTNAMLEEHGLKTGLLGTVKVKNGDSYEPAKLTTPESLDLQRYLAEMRDNGVSHVTMEVSSSALALDRVAHVDFDIVTLNNISREHIDLHGGFDNYWAAKAGLVRSASPGAWAVLNLDDPYSASLVKEARAKVLTYGINDRSGDLHCSNLDLSTGRGRFTVKIQKPFETEGVTYAPGGFDIRLSVPGYHSVANSMAAIAVALLCGVPVPTIQAALKGFAGVERRFEFIFEDDFLIIDDHFANSGNIDATLGTLEFMNYDNLKIVYAIRGDRGPTVNRENAETIIKWAPRLGIKEIIATLSESHVTEKDRVKKEELEVFLDVVTRAGIKVHLFTELPDALSRALEDVKTDDVILLSGCQGMDYGAQVALRQLKRIRPDLDEERLFRALKKRVAGVS